MTIVTIHLDLFGPSIYLSASHLNDPSEAYQKTFNVLCIIFGDQ